MDSETIAEMKARGLPVELCDRALDRTVRAVDDDAYGARDTGVVLDRGVGEILPHHRGDIGEIRLAASHAHDRDNPRGESDAGASAVTTVS